MVEPKEYKKKDGRARPSLPISALYDNMAGKYGVDPITIKSFNEFDKFLESRGRSLRRRKHYTYYLPRLASLLKPVTFQKAKKENYEKLISALANKKWVNERTGKGTVFGKRTQTDFKIALKSYVKWLRGFGDTSQTPLEVAWIKIGMKQKRLMPSDILTDDEFTKLLKASKDARDRAFLNVAWEGGFRTAEILGLKIKDLVFTDDGVKITVDGKTGIRTNLMIASAPALASYLEYHPYANDENAPLWVMKREGKDEEGNAKYKQMSYEAVRKMLGAIFEKAGITKHAHVYLFRHSCACRLAKRFTEFQLKQYMGWEMDSSMPIVYVTMSGRDLDNSILAMHGLTTEAKMQEKITIKDCLRCKFKNSPERERCERCAAPLDLSAALKAESGQFELMKKVFTELMKDAQKGQSQKMVEEELERKRSELIKSSI